MQYVTNMRKYIVYTIVLILLVIGLLLILGELEQYNTLTFIVTKCVGLVAIYVAYEVYKMNKLTWLDKEGLE